MIKRLFKNKKTFLIILLFFAAVSFVPTISTTYAAPGDPPVPVENVESHTNAEKPKNSFLINALKNSNLISNTLNAVSYYSGRSESSVNPCGIFNAISIQCFTYIGLLLLYIPMTIAGWLLWTAGKLFNIAVGVSIYNGSFDYSNIKIVEAGWLITRDVANIILVFMLLIISGGIILRLERFGSKKILSYLIIVALLVNFSLPITQVVIDLSNVFAHEFYSNITTNTDKAIPKCDPAIAEGPCPQEKTNLDISGALVKGLSIQKSFQLVSKDTWKNQVKRQQANDSAKLLISTFWSIIVITVAAFVMFILGILFLVRMVILWILMILSPLAFVFWILPSTSTYAMQWWKKLFEQAFFAPAALFMLYIVASAIKNNFFETLFHNNTTDLTNIEDFTAAAGGVFANQASLLAQYITLIILLIASVLVAKQMGAHGASSTIGAAIKVRKSAQGYAGKVGKKLSLQAAGRAANRIRSSEGRVFSTFRKMPGADRALMATARSQRKSIQQTMEKYKDYNNKELKALSVKKTTSKTDRAAIMATLAGKDRNDITEDGAFNMNHLEGSRRIMDNFGMSADVSRIDKLNPLVAANQLKGDERTKKIRENVKKMSKEDIKNMDEKILGNVEVMSAIAHSGTEEAIKGIIHNKGGDFRTMLTMNYGKLINEYRARKGIATQTISIDPSTGDVAGASKKDLADALSDAGNSSASDYVMRSPTMGIVGFKDVKEEKSKPSEGIKVVESSGGGTRTDEEQARNEQILREIKQDRENRSSQNT